MLLLSRSQQQDADNILQTSSLSWPGKKKIPKMKALRHIMSSQPFTNPPSGNGVFQGRLGMGRVARVVKGTSGKGGK